jgi:hypothetical protein
MKEFNIGDVVIIKEYKDVPEEHRTQGMARLSGERGTIIDRMFSEANNCYVYTIKFDNFEAVSHKKWRSEHLSLWVEKKITYRLDMDVADNVVIAILIEQSEDGSETEIARNHAHIIHEGVFGIVQALSYATKKIYERMGGFSNVIR